MLTGKMSPIFKFAVKGTISHNHQKKPKALAVDEDIFEKLSMNKIDFASNTIDTETSIKGNKRPTTTQKRRRNKSKMQIQT